MQRATGRRVTAKLSPSAKADVTKLPTATGEVAGASAVVDPSNQPDGSEQRASLLEVTWPVLPSGRPLTESELEQASQRRAWGSKEEMTEVIEWSFPPVSAAEEQRSARLFASAAVDGSEGAKTHELEAPTDRVDVSGGVISKEPQASEMQKSKELLTLEVTPTGIDKATVPALLTEEVKEPSQKDATMPAADSQEVDSAEAEPSEDVAPSEKLITKKVAASETVTLSAEVDDTGNVTETGEAVTGGIRASQQPISELVDPTDFEATIVMPTAVPKPSKEKPDSEELKISDGATITRKVEPTKVEVTEEISPSWTLPPTPEGKATGGFADSLVPGMTNELKPSLKPAATAQAPTHVQISDTAANTDAPKLTDVKESTGPTPSRQPRGTARRDPTQPPAATPGFETGSFTDSEQQRASKPVETDPPTPTRHRVTAKHPPTVPGHQHSSTFRQSEGVAPTERPPYTAAFQRTLMANTGALSLPTPEPRLTQVVLPSGIVKTVLRQPSAVLVNSETGAPSDWQPAPTSTLEVTTGLGASSGVAPTAAVGATKLDATETVSASKTYRATGAPTGSRTFTPYPKSTPLPDPTPPETAVATATASITLEATASRTVEDDAAGVVPLGTKKSPWWIWLLVAGGVVLVALVSASIILWLRRGDSTTSTEGAAAKFLESIGLGFENGEPKRKPAEVTLTQDTEMTFTSQQNPLFQPDLSDGEGMSEIYVDDDDDLEPPPPLSDGDGGGPKPEEDVEFRPLTKRFENLPSYVQFEDGAPLEHFDGVSSGVSDEAGAAAEGEVWGQVTLTKRSTRDIPAATASDFPVPQDFAGFPQQPYLEYGQAYPQQDDAGEQAYGEDVDDGPGQYDDGEAYVDPTADEEYQQYQDDGEGWDDDALRM
jgi:hypothetical protein